MANPNRQDASCCAFTMPVLVAVVLAVVGAIIFDWPWWVRILIGLVVLNVLTLSVYRRDKQIAVTNEVLPKEKQLTRVPESALLSLALIGGSLGAMVGMYGFDGGHKTSKQPFNTCFWLIVISQLFVLATLLVILPEYFD